LVVITATCVLAAGAAVATVDALCVAVAVAVAVADDAAALGLVLLLLLPQPALTPVASTRSAGMSLPRFTDTSCRVQRIRSITKDAIRPCFFPGGHSSAVLDRLGRSRVEV
jgi:hypothetical protein